jgi:Raf kinase inhibitor-like YbhB/YbcL family protein
MLLLLACAGAPDLDSSDLESSDTDTADTADSDPGAFVVTVPALTSSAGNPLADECAWELPAVYECTNPNPEVRWSGAPEGTVAFALVFDDPDAGDYDHWAVVNLPADATGIDAGLSGEGLTPDLAGDAYQLDNGFGFAGYLGSCPPAPHVYRWRVWALSAALDADLSRFSQVENQAEERALATAEACHIYGPKTK